MYLDTRALFLPALFVLNGVLAQQTASATSGAPDVTYPAGDAFVFCSAQDCTGTCEVAVSVDVPSELGEGAPNDMGYQSIYWYSPGTPSYTLYTSVNYYGSSEPVSIGPNTCYNLYNDGVPTDYYYYWYYINETA